MPWCTHFTVQIKKIGWVLHELWSCSVKFFSQGEGHISVKNNRYEITAASHVSSFWKEKKWWWPYCEDWGYL